MSYLVFARKYRPQTFEQVVEQGHVTRTLSHAIESGRLAHAILFTGPRGTGKTTVARILAKCVNCFQGPSALPCNQCQACLEITAGKSADVFEIDGASNNSVDQIRELRDNLKYMPSYSRNKIYIIDEVHMLSLAAFNALLKTLEEPPAHIKFVFATTEPHKIPVTILSRCQRHDLRRIETASIARHLEYICSQEKVMIDSASLMLIAREAGGSVRDGLSILDHIVSCVQESITTDLITELLGIAQRGNFFDIVEALINRDIRKILLHVDDVWRKGLEIKRFYTDLLLFLHQLMLVKVGGPAARLVDLTAEEVARLKNLDIDYSQLLQIIDTLFKAESSIRFSGQAKMALEIAFLRLWQTPPALAIDTLVDRLDQLRNCFSNLSLTNVADVKTTVEPTAVAPPQGVPETAGERPAAEEQETLRQEPTSLDQMSLWERLIEEAARRRSSLGAALKKCSLTFNSPDEMELTVNANEFVYKSIVKQTALLEEIIRELTGDRVRLKIVADLQEAQMQQALKKTADRLKQNALSHPAVMEALEFFDGTVVDVKVAKEDTR